MRCPVCNAKKGRHEVGCELVGLTLRRYHGVESFGDGPVRPALAPEPQEPVYAVFHPETARSLDARLASLEAAVGAALARLAAQDAYPDGAPPGVVSPHVGANLDRLVGWIEVQRAAESNPLGARQYAVAGQRASFLEFLLSLIAEAKLGRDVLDPPRPDIPIRS